MYNVIHLGCTHPWSKTLMLLCFAWFGWISIKQVWSASESLIKHCTANRFRIGSKLHPNLIKNWSKLVANLLQTSSPDTWYLIPDTWYPIPDTWYLIPDTWYLIPDTWDLRPETWDLRPETWDLRPDTLIKIHGGQRKYMVGKPHTVAGGEPTYVVRPTIRAWLPHHVFALPTM